MADFATGTWLMVDSKQFDEYMKAIGVGLVMRKMGNLAKPSQIITVDENNSWNIKTVTTFKSTDVVYPIGEEFEETTMDGRQVKTVATVEGQKLILKQTGNPDSTIIRDFNGSEMTMTLEANGVTCTRYYKKSES